MAFLVIPHQVTDTTATIWVGALGDGDVREKTVVLVLKDGDVRTEVELNPSLLSETSQFP